MSRLPQRGADLRPGPTGGLPIPITLLALLLPACAPRQVIVERAPQAYYQTGFPIHDTSFDLERISRSVKRIHFTAEYRTYIFPREAGVTDRDDVLSPAVLARAVDTLTESDSKSGTAAILSRAPRSLALLTNHHVVHYPLARISYYDDPEARRSRRATPRTVASIAIRIRERGALADHPQLGAFEVLARDTAQDLAILDVRLPDRNVPGYFAPMPVAIGDPMRLSWGSFVYVVGFPRGYPMVTPAMVSDPNRDRRGAFLTNGLWNEGISGGAILAVRGETGRLEWVGVARAGAGASETRIVPRTDEVIDESDVPILYEGPFFVEAVLRIQYGITFSVPMTAIRGFIGRYRHLLTSRGHEIREY